MLRGEFIKITTSRTAWSLWVGAVVVVAVGAFSTTSSMAASALDGTVHGQQFFLLASINLSLFALLTGVRGVTDEFRHGTIAWTVLSIRRRWLIVAARSVVSAAWAAAVALTAQVVMVVVALGVASGKGGDLHVAASDGPAMIGLMMSTALWATIGVAVGTVVRHQVSAVAAALVWVLAIENLGVGFLRDAGRFLPGQAGHALALAEAASLRSSAVGGGIVLLAYGVVAVGLAAAALSRRSITLAS